VLIADDHPVFRSGLATLLAAADDVEVVGEAADGRAAVAAASELDADARAERHRGDARACGDAPGRRRPRSDDARERRLGLRRHARGRARVPAEGS
jgi:hypothetical protein